MLNPTDVKAEATRALQWEITADKLTRFEDPASVIAEGNVILTKLEKITGTQKNEPSGDDWADLLGEDTASEENETEDTELEGLKKNTLTASKAVPVMGEDTYQERPEQVGEPKKLVTNSTVITTIKADWMVYDVNLGTVKVRGDVFIDIGPDQLSATDGIVNLNRETGTFNNALIVRQYKNMHIEGRVIEKTGDITYHIEDGWLITCKLQDGEAPPWSFHAADANITDGGYAFLKHATFRIKNIPVFYSPIMLLPAKRTRQTGFLFPAVSVSDRDGFNMEWPFF
ncbi:MAG: LPS-assembly protein LptD, partial [Candidatus Electrothrix sp. AR4]|nr:LPS-assembly protein LptD [Candidatus Electrothrix sp. AR4]